MSTVAFLGLGHMGGPMAANLLAAGHTVRAFDPVTALKEAAAEKGAQVFDSGSEAVAEADVVITSLPNGDIVKAVYAEALPAAREGTLFIDTSTISVDDAREIHAQATERGLVQLDAPVSGGVKGATAGTLAFMVGGEAEAVERARPVLEPLAGKIIHCGSSGTGQAAKLCNNMVLAVQQIAAGEAFVLAEKLGLSALTVRRDHWRDRQLLGDPHELSCARTGSDVTCQQRLQAGLRDRVDEQGHRPGDGRGQVDRFVGAAGQPCGGDLRQIRRRPRRQGLQRGHRDDPQGLGLDPSPEHVTKRGRAEG